MQPWAFYPAFLALAGSIGLLSHIAYSQYDGGSPRSLSELVVDEKALLRRFRRILLVCGTLFAISVYWYIVPRSARSELVVLAWTVEYIGVILAAVLPAKGRTFWWHIGTAHFMGIGMLLLAYAFGASLSGNYAALEIVLALGMSAFALLTFADRKRYIFYELAFIFTSNFSIVIACLALR